VTTNRWPAVYTPVVPERGTPANARQWRSGVSGNPGGHPVGARGRFSEQHYARSKFHVTKEAYHLNKAHKRTSPASPRAFPKCGRAVGEIACSPVRHQLTVSRNLAMCTDLQAVLTFGQPAG
jgi:hypothetical protein